MTDATMSAVEIAAAMQTYERWEINSTKLSSPSGSTTHDGEVD